VRRRPQSLEHHASPFLSTISSKSNSLVDAPQKSSQIALVLSGGGARAAYQVGALKAIARFMNEKFQQDKLNIVIGSSIGAINGLVFAACLRSGIISAITQLEEVWRIRTFRNTFLGKPSSAFFRAVQMAIVQYLAPGPHATDRALFNPKPLMDHVDAVIELNGGLSIEKRDPALKAIAVMTTIESSSRAPLLFLSSSQSIPEENLSGASFDVHLVQNLTAKHGFASAALPAVLPPVEIDLAEGKVVRLVDGGISQNIPIDPAVRIGAEVVFVVDISGRDWWLKRYNEKGDKRPSWEVPANHKTFCLRPPDTYTIRCQKNLGSLLKESIGNKRSKFISALGPVWPVFSLLKAKLGQEVAYEAISYVALDPDYLAALIELGEKESEEILKQRLT
jgi:predicted acylesterase/phospholipase RssA